MFAPISYEIIDAPAFDIGASASAITFMLISAPPVLFSVTVIVPT